MSDSILKNMTAERYLDHLMMMGFRPTLYFFPISQRMKFDEGRPDTEMSAQELALYSKLYSDWYSKPENWPLVHFKCVEWNCIHLVEPENDYLAGGAASLSRYVEAQENG